jgi:hypothetical protein
VFAPTGPAAADYVQIALGREIEWRAGPVVNPDYRPWGEEELLDPGWPRDKPLPDTARLAGPVYRLRRDRLAQLLTDDDVATLKHLAREGMGENSLRALASDLAYLEAWAAAATGDPLPWPYDIHTSF